MEDTVRRDADEYAGGGEAATTTGPRTPDCRPDDRFDEPRRVVGVSPMIMYRGVAEEADRHESPARVGVPTSTYGGFGGVTDGEMRGGVEKRSAATRPDP